MNSMDMKLSIYESYKNGEITKDAAKRLMVALEDHHNDSELDSAMDEMAIAESAFMESAVNYSNGNEEFSVFEKKAETFGDKVKKAWEAFKKWVKSIIDAVGKKITQIKDKITGKDKGVFSKLPLDKIEKYLKSVVSHLKPPYNADDAIYLQGAGLLTSSVVGTAALKKFDFAIVNSIKDSLIKIDSKLMEIESKAEESGSKMIVVLRPIVNLANKAIMSVVGHEFGAEKRAADELTNATANLTNAQNDFDSKNYSSEVNALREQIKTFYDDKVNPATLAVGKALVDRDEKYEAMSKVDPNDTAKFNAAHSTFAAAANAVEKAYDKWTPLNEQHQQLIKKLKGLENANKAYADAVEAHARAVMKSMCVFIRKDISDASKLLGRVKSKEDAEKFSDVFDNYIKEIEIYLKQADSATSMFNEIDTQSKALIKRDKIENLKRSNAQIAIYKKQLDVLKNTAKKRGF